MFRKLLSRLLCKIGLHLWDKGDAAQVCLVCHLRGAFAAKLTRPTLTASGEPGVCATRPPYQLSSYTDETGQAWGAEYEPNCPGVPSKEAETQKPQSLGGWKDLCLPPLPEQVLRLQSLPEQAQEQSVEVSKTLKAKSATASR